MRIVAVHIEGLGKVDGGGQSNGYLLTSEVPDGFDLTTSSYDWRPVMHQTPRVGRHSIEPHEPRFRFAPFDLNLSAGSGQDWLAELLLFKPTFAETTLDEPAELSSSDPTVTVTDPSDLSAGDVFYVDGETIYIDSISGSDLTVTRGYYGSAQAAHRADANIYTRPPFFEGRRVTLYTYDLTDASVSLVDRERGVIDGKITMDGPSMEVPVRSVTAPLSRTKINRDPVRGEDSDLQFNKISDDAEEFAGESYWSGRVISAADSDQTHVHKPGTPEASRQFWDIEGELYASSGGGLVYKPFGSGVRDLDEVPRTQSQRAMADVSPVEVFCVHRQADQDLESIYSSTSIYNNLPAFATVGGTTFSFDADMRLTYVYHPLAIFAGIVFSTLRGTAAPERFDVFHAPNIGLSLGYLFDDDVKEKIHSLIQSPYGQMQQIDRFEIGGGGKSVKVLKKLQEELLHPYGYRIGPTKNGKLNVFRTGLPDVADYASARANQLSPIGGPDAVHVVDNGEGSSVDVIEAQVGGNAYSPSRAITLQAETGQPDRTLQLGGPRSKLNLSTLDPAGSIQAARRIIIGQALLQTYAAKRLKVRVPDWHPLGLDYGLGEFVTLDGVQITDAWLIDSKGNRTSEITNETEWVAQIIGRMPYDDFAGFEVELLFNATQIVRYRAPSGVVSGASSSSVNLESESFNDGSDAGEFNAGDEITVYTPSGAVVDDTGVIDNISGDTLNLTGTWSTTPSAGQYVRLADLSRYDNDTIDTYTDRVYVFMSDTQATLGDAGEASDIYGI